MSRLYKNIPSKNVLISGDAGMLRRTLELPARAAWAKRHLDAVTSVMTTLFADDNFVTLLRAESILTLPKCLASAFTNLPLGKEHEPTKHSKTKTTAQTENS